MLKAFCAFKRKKSDGVFPESGGRGYTHMFYVIDSEATSVDLLGLGPRSKRQSKTQKSEKFLSESLLWNAECIFPEQQSSMVSRLLYPARPDLLNAAEHRVLRSVHSVH